MFDQDNAKTPLTWAKRHPLLAWFIGVFLVPLIVLVLLIANHLQSTLPELSGNIALTGIKQPVTIHRDLNGALTISAKTDNDAFFAVGYAHAQDRLWQLTLVKYMSQGRLSEIFGQEALGFDSYINTLGIFSAAEKSLSSLDAHALNSLQSYADGINSWLEQNYILPIEFTLTGVKPERWQPQDTIAWLKLFSLNMAENYQQELSQLLLSQVLKPVALQDLLHQDSKGPVTVQYAGGATNELVNAGVQIEHEHETLDTAHLASLVSLSHSLKQQLLFDGSNIGSNAWAVKKQYSDGPSVILANDPHLGLEIPSIWYAVNIAGDKLNVSGMNLIGGPIVLLGRNDKLAWGATNMLADTQDLFYLRINPENPNQYLLDGNWQDFSTKDFQLSVKAPFPAVLREPLAPVDLRVRHTVFGPVISDLIGAVEQPMALSWVGQNEQDTSYQAFLDLNYAQNWQEFRLALSQHVAPAMNVVYADSNQNIGYLGIGQIPVRETGTGSVPLPGWLSENLWRDFIPSDEMPTAFNPETNYLVSANNRVVDDSYPYFISNGFAAPARAERIIQRLEELSKDGKVSLSDHKSIQLDSVDGDVTQLLTFLKTLPEPKDETAELYRHLSQWEGSTNVESIGSTVFFTVLRHLRKELYSDDLSLSWGRRSLGSTLQNMLAEFSVAQVYNSLTSNSYNWCDYQNTPQAESCVDVFHNALEKSQKELSLLLSGSTDDWQWGNAHQLILAHRPFSDIRGLDFIFERTASNGGSPNSINVSSFNWDPNDGFQQEYGAGFRQIMSLGESPEHLYVNSTGQSGNVFSTHYDDMVEAFVSGNFYSLITAPGDDGRVVQLTPVETNQ